MTRTSYKVLFSSLIIFTILVLDQGSKLLVLKSQIPTGCNTGFAFGLFQGPVNTLIATITLLLVIYIFTRQKEFLIWLPLAAVIGGGASNIIDRLVHGCVVDFITIPYWPAFNLADATQTIGVLTVILWTIKKKDQEKVS